MVEPEKISTVTRATCKNFAWYNLAQNSGILLSEYSVKLNSQ